MKTKATRKARFSVRRFKEDMVGFEVFDTIPYLSQSLVEQQFPKNRLIFNEELFDDQFDKESAQTAIIKDVVADILIGLSLDRPVLQEPMLY